MIVTSFTIFEKLILEHNQFISAVKRCRHEENDEEYCLGRGECIKSTGLCRYCYVWTCRKDARDKAKERCKNTRGNHRKECEAKIKSGHLLSPAFHKTRPTKHKA